MTKSQNPIVVLVNPRYQLTAALVPSLLDSTASTPLPPPSHSYALAVKTRIHVMVDGLISPSTSADRTLVVETFFSFHGSGHILNGTDEQLNGCVIK